MWKQLFCWVFSADYKNNNIFAGCFLCLQATDPDAGVNGQVFYRIVDHPNLFVITSNGSIYTKVPLDRESKNQYDLIVEASDGAVDPRRTTLVVSVQVLDIDDNSPVFSQKIYVVNVPENTPVGTVVLKLSVSFNLNFFMLIFVHYDFFRSYKIIF